MEEEWRFPQVLMPLHLLLLCELLLPTFPSIDALLLPSDPPSALACLSNTHSPSSILQMISDFLASFLCMLKSKHEPLPHLKLIANTTIHSCIHIILDEPIDRYLLSLPHIVDIVGDNSVSMNHIPVTTTDIVQLRFASILPNGSVVIALPTDYSSSRLQPRNPIATYLFNHYNQYSDSQGDALPVSNHQPELRGYSSVQLHPRVVAGEKQLNHCSSVRHILHGSIPFQEIPVLVDTASTLVSLQDEMNEFVEVHSNDEEILL